jgi:hypothetical protein
MTSRDGHYGSVELEAPLGLVRRRPRALSFPKLILTVLGAIGVVALIVSLTGAQHAQHLLRQQPPQEFSPSAPGGSPATEEPSSVADNCQQLPSVSPDRVHIEGSHPRHVEEGWTVGERSDSAAPVSLVFAVRMQNLDLMRDVCSSVSNPRSENYTKYLTLAQARALFAAPQSFAAVHQFVMQGIAASAVAENEAAPEVFANFDAATGAHGKRLRRMRQAAQPQTAGATKPSRRHTVYTTQNLDFIRVRYALPFG